MEELIISAPAKINLALKVLGLRSDGYHQLEMIMQSIDLHDQVYLKRISKGIKVSSSNPDLPLGEDNLAYQAADLIMQESEQKGGIEIHIKKSIPLAAGLAGGSTDAAAVLKGINLLYQLDYSDESLKKMAGQIGSDVPFCLRGGTAYAYNRGEKISQLPNIKKTSLILITPSRRVSTARVYREYDNLNLESNIPVKELVYLLENKKEINWSEGWANDLEAVTRKIVSDIDEIKRILLHMGVKFSLMSGSGSTVFGVVANSAEAKYISENWPRKSDFVVATTTKQEFFE